MKLNRLVFCLNVICNSRKNVEILENSNISDFEEVHLLLLLTSVYRSMQQN